MASDAIRTANCHRQTAINVSARTHGKRIHARTPNERTIERTNERRARARATGAHANHHIVFAFQAAKRQHITHRHTFARTHTQHAYINSHEHCGQRKGGWPRQVHDIFVPYRSTKRRKDAVGRRSWILEMDTRTYALGDVLSHIDAFMLDSFEHNTQTHDILVPTETNHISN